MFSCAVTMFHMLFLGLVTIVVIPTLPPGLDMVDIQYNQAIGYFPLALSSSSFPLQRQGSSLSFIFYAAIVLSGLHMLLGAASAAQVVVEAAWSRLRLISGPVASALGLCSTVPLCFSTGFSLLAVYERYGWTLPCVILGWAEVSLVFWYYGAGHLSKRTSGIFLGL